MKAVFIVLEIGALTPSDISGSEAPLPFSTGAHVRVCVVTVSPGPSWTLSAALGFPYPADPVLREMSKLHQCCYLLKIHANVTKCY